MKNILIVLTLIVGFILINQTVSAPKTPSPVGCPAGTTLVDYKDGVAMQEPICKGTPTE